MSTRARDQSAPAYLPNTAHEEATLQAAEAILQRRLERLGRISDPTTAADFLRMRLAHLPNEEFHAMFLDSRHRILSCEMLFRGGIDGAEVHPRVVAQRALTLNAAAVIFAHNHPSGVAEPSAADRAITRRLCDALQLLEIRVLDHLVVGAEGTVSFAARGLL
jgi:DNA repair protein RadC